MDFGDVGPRGLDQPAYDASAIEVLEGLEPVRRRPGMYIGGTDKRALHHLAAEVLDNAMDEAVAGHANRIEVEFREDFSLTVRDNGRGIPVDPHPKFPKKSALEVILTTLHAGGKFSGKAYQTAGGLHGVGISVVNALSEHMHIEVVRDRTRHEQHYSRGKPLGRLKNTGSTANRKGTSVTFMPDSEIFGKSARLDPANVMAMVRSKAYLYSGLEMRWKCNIALAGIPETATFHFPGGLAEYLRDTLDGAAVLSDNPFAGKVDFAERFGHGTRGSVEWAVNWATTRDGFTKSYCNTIPTSDGGTHEAGFWAAILKGVRAYGEFVSNKRTSQINREDLQSSGCALVSCFIEEPEFAGQTKDRLANAAAQRLVENSVRDHFDNWLAADPRQSDAIVEHLVAQSEMRLRRKAEKETMRKSATKRLRLPGKLVDCTNATKDGTELFIVEGDSAGGSAKMARDRHNQALLPLRGKILNVLGASSAKLGQNSEINDLCLALGVRSGSRFSIDDLRYEKVIIMTDADVDGAHIASLLMTFFYTQLRQIIELGHLFLACPPLYRITQGTTRLYARDDAEKEEMLANGLSGRGKIEVSRFKGLGEMDAKDLKQTTMSPATRRLIQVEVESADMTETSSLITRLMGRKPEERFLFIQNNARFASGLDI